eukprot:Rhum_TRINITY_DN7609_c0_g9::Rhum_TRINITY_DN7609_c0_g9_i1::g.23887::m.23887
MFLFFFFLTTNGLVVEQERKKERRKETAKHIQLLERRERGGERERERERQKAAVRRIFLHNTIAGAGASESRAKQQAPPPPTSSSIVQRLGVLLHKVREGNALVLEGQRVRVMPPDRPPVRHRQDGGALLLHLLVEPRLIIDVDLRRALVEDRKLRLVVEHACQPNLLPLAARQHVLPLTHGVQAVFLAGVHVQALGPLQDLQQLLVRLARHQVGVHDLVPQRPVHQVRTLRQEEDVLRLRRPVQLSRHHRPQPGQHPEQRRLAAPVRPRDQHVVAHLHLEAHRLHQKLPVRRHDRHVLEPDRAVARHDLAVVLQQRVHRRVRRGRRHHAVRRLLLLHLLVPVHAAAHLLQHPVQRRQPLAASRQVRHLLQALHQALRRVRGVRHQLPVRHQHLGRVAGGHLRPAEQHRRSAHRAADNAPQVLGEVPLAHVVPERLVEQAAVRLRQPGEGTLQPHPLRGGAAVERNLLRVRDQARMLRTPQAVLLGDVRRQLSEGGPHVPEQACGEHRREARARDAAGAHALPEVEGEEEAVEHRLRDLRDEVGQVRRELLDVVGHHLVRVLDAVVDVAHLVEHVRLQVQVVVVLHELRPERKGELLLQVADGRVAHRRGDTEGEPHGGQLHELPELALHQALDHLSVQVRHRDAEQRARREDDDEGREDARLLAARRRQQDLQQQHEVVPRVVLAVLAAGAAGADALLPAEAGPVHHGEEAEEEHDDDEADRSVLPRRCGALLRRREQPEERAPPAVLGRGGRSQPGRGFAHGGWGEEGGGGREGRGYECERTHDLRLQ